MSCNKLKANKVQEIRDLYATGKYTHEQLGKVYGVSKAIIRTVVKGVQKPYYFDKERFWSKVDTNNGEDACWEWMACKDRDGYGQFKLNRKIEQANRVAYMLSKGPIPEGEKVRHTCDNPACCNPAHLILGTQKANVRDMIERGRSYTGGNKPKLSDLESLEARFYAEIGIKRHAIAKYFKVSGTPIRKAMQTDPMKYREQHLKIQSKKNHTEIA